MISNCENASHHTKRKKSSLIIKKNILKNFRYNENFRKEAMQKEKLQRNYIDYARIFALCT